jgi:hypothetical protein
MFRRKFELTANELAYERPDIRLVLQSEIMSDSARYPDMFHLWQSRDRPQKFNKLGLVSFEIAADVGEKTTYPSASSRFGGARYTPHVCGRSANVREASFPVRVLRQTGHFVQD